MTLNTTAFQPNIYYASKTEALTHLLLENIAVAKAQQKSPFQSTFIIIPNSGVQRYLETEVAKRFGISAQINIVYPAQFLWQCYQLLVEDISHLKPVNSRKITLDLIALFDRDYKQTEWGQALSEWLDKSNSLQQQFKFAKKLANLFNSYITQRPEWVDTWRKNQSMTQQSIQQYTQNDSPIFSDKKSEQLAITEAWQSQLFKALGLIKYSRGKTQALFHQQLKQNGSEKLKSHFNFSDIHLFGFNSMPTARLNDFIALAKGISSHFYIINPSVNYWQDIVPSHIKEKHILTTEDEQRFISVGHPLLASWGQSGKSLISELSTFDAINIDENLKLSPNNLLQWLQHSITYFKEDNPVFDNLSKGVNTDLSAPLSSLSLHAASSTRQEIEILYETLCKQLDKNPDLNPNDIIVMLPSISDYAAHIKSIFPSYYEDNHLPYSLADQSNLEQYPDVAGFLLLLQLISDNFSAQRLFECLSQQSIQTRYQLTDEQIKTIHSWLLRNHFSHGFHDTSNGKKASLEKLMDQLILAEIGGENSEIKKENTYRKNADFYDTNQKQTLYQFANFIADITPFSDLKNKQLSLAEWHEKLFALAKQFIGEDGVLIDLLSQWSNAILDQSKENYQRYYFDTILCDWESHLSQEKLHGPFLSGGISFCTALPMRIIPAKFIAVLGLNHDIPNTIKKDPINLIQAYPKWSDTVEHKSFKYLFLETLLCARDFLYLSYCGQSPQTIEKSPPSIVIEELMGYLSSCGINTSHITYQYPIQTFINEGGSPLKTYQSLYQLNSTQWAENQWGKSQVDDSPVSHNLGDPEPETMNEYKMPEQWTVSLMVNYLINPSLAYLKYTLNITPLTLNKTESLMENELFNHKDNALISWQYDDLLLKEQLASENNDPSTEHIYQQTALLLQQNNLAAPDIILNKILSDKLSRQSKLLEELKKITHKQLNFTQFITLNHLTYPFSCLVHDKRYYEDKKFCGFYDIQLGDNLKIKKLLTIWIKHLMLTVNLGPSPEKNVVSYLMSYQNTFACCDISYDRALSTLSLILGLISKLYQNPLFAELSMKSYKKAPFFKMYYEEIDNSDYPGLTDSQIKVDDPSLSIAISELANLLNESIVCQS